MIGFSLNPINWVTSAAGAVLGTAGGAVIDAIVGWIESGLAYIAGEVAMRLSDLSAGSFDETALELAGRAKWVALVLVVGSMFVSAAGAVLSRDGSIGDTVKEIPLTLAFLAMWWVAATTVATALSHLTAWFLSDALLDAMRSGLVIDAGVNSFVRAVIGVLMVIFLLVFYVELLVLNHMVTIGVIVGQVAIGLRPSRGTRGVSGQMVRNLVALAAGPPLATLSLALTVGNAGESAGSLLPSLTALAGLVVSVLAPLLASRFLPLGGDGGNPARALIGAGVQIAGAVAGGAVAGGAVAGGAMAARGAAGPAPGGGQAAYAISGPGPSGGGGGVAPPGGSGGGGSGGGPAPGAPSGQATSAPASTVASSPAGGPAPPPPPPAAPPARPASPAPPAPAPVAPSSTSTRQRAAAASAAVADLVRVGDEQ